MKTAYCDSNFWVRLFIEFPESERARDKLEEMQSEPPVRIPMTWLQRLEVANAFCLLTFQARSGRLPNVTPEQAAAALQNFEEISKDGSYAVPRSLNIEDLEPRCMELCGRHTARHGFRVYDIMNVSAALLLGCGLFLSFDRKATKLAELEGLSVMDFE